LWHAIDRDTGDIAAYIFGMRKSEVLKELGFCWGVWG
jgi:IS1 family transposase